MSDGVQRQRLCPTIKIRLIIRCFYAPKARNTPRAETLRSCASPSDDGRYAILPHRGDPRTAPLARGSRDQGRPAGDHHRSLHPVRHGYVADINRYPYSSFPRLIERQGREALAAQFRAHPEFHALRIDEDDF